MNNKTTLNRLAKAIIASVLFLSGTFFASSLHAADRYWVGGAGTWDGVNNTTTHWSATSGGTGGASFPTQNDNVIFDGNSGTGAVTTSGTVNCLSLDFNGVLSTAGTASSITSFTIGSASGNQYLYIYGSLWLRTGMTIAYNATTAYIYFFAASGSWTITSNGNTFPNININFTKSSSTADWTLQDAFTSNGTVNMNNGTLTTNNKTMNLYKFFSNGSGTRTLNLGSSIINFNSSSGPGTWDMSPGTNLTLNAGTSTLNFTHSSYSSNGTFYGGGKTYNNVTFTVGGCDFRDGGNTFNNLSLNSARSTYQLVANGTQYIASGGSFVINPGCAYLTPVKLQSLTSGTQATISAPANATINVNYATIKDINGTGGASFVANNSTSVSNNTGWTINAPVTRNMYWVGGTGNWSAISHWSLTSGGSPVTDCVPTQIDNVIFDGNSGSGTVTVDPSSSYCLSMDWNGVLSSAHTASSISTLTGSGTNLYIYGSLWLKSGMTISYAGNVLFAATSGSYTITSNGSGFTGTVYFGNSASTATWTLQDAFKNNYSTLGSLVLNYGTLNTNNQTLNIYNFSSSNSNTRTLNLGSSAINLNAAAVTFGGGNWSISNGTNLTLNAGTSTLNFTAYSSAFGGQFYGGGKTYYNVIVSVGTLDLKDGGNTFYNLSLNGTGSTYKFLAGGTQTITNAFYAGKCGGPSLTIQSSTAGSQATISMASGTSVYVNNVSLQDMNGTGGASFTAVNSTNVSGNAGWTFTTTTSAPPPPTAGSNSPVCTGTTLSLTAVGPSGATYSWTGPNGFTSSTQNPTVSSSATNAMAGTYSVTATACSPAKTSTAGTTTVTVNTTPSAPTAGSNSPVCLGSTLSLTASTIAGATSYSWTGPNGFTSSAQNPTVSSSATGAMAGTYSVTAINGCGNSVAGTTTVTVNTTTSAPAAGSNSPVCSGSTLSLTASTIAGATYSWTGPNGFTSSAQNPTVSSSATGAMAGTYSVTATACNITSAAGTTSVTVNTTPSAPAAGSNSPVCTGTTLSLTAGTIAGATYSWTGPNSFTSSQQNPTVSSSATGAMAGTYSVTATLNGCTGSAGTNTVTVNTTPSAPAAGSNSPVCTGTTLSLTAGTIAGAIYSWTGPDGFTSSAQNPTVSSSATGAMAGTYSVTATLNGCTGSAGTTTVTVNTTPSSPAAGSNSPVCTGTTLSLTAGTIAGASYSWTGPNSFTSSQQNPTVSSSATGAMAGTYSVTATLNGCTGSAGTATVTVAPCNFNFTVKLYLQGYYLGGSKMSPLLHLLGATSPTVVDTVTIELRDSVSGQHNLIYSYKDTLSSNGNMVCTFPAADTGYLYIVVKHRNSIETWSNGATHVSPNGTYDFTASGAGLGTTAALGGGVYGIYSGDVTNGSTLGVKDGNINASDKKAVQDTLPSFQIGVYDVRDITGDGFLDEDDYRVMQNNIPLAVTVQQPN